MQQSYPDLDTYKREVFARQDDLLKNIMPDAAEQGIPRISVSPEAGQTLYLLAKTIGAKKILEFGALAGYSGIWLARALPEDGQFITLEIESKHAEVTRSNYEKAGLSDQTDVRLGDGTKLMQDAVQDGPFDLIFIDADKESYPQYLDFALKTRARAASSSPTMPMDTDMHTAHCPKAMVAAAYRTTTAALPTTPNSSPTSFP